MPVNLLHTLGGGLESLQRFAEQAEKRTKEVLTEPAEVLADEWRSQLSRPGDRVRPWGRGRLGAALRRSRPGEPPLEQSGRLRSSISVRRVSDSVVRIGSDAPHSLILEFGSRTVHPRPHARPALIAAKPKMGSKLVASLKRGR